MLRKWAKILRLCSFWWLVVGIEWTAFASRCHDLAVTLPGSLVRKRLVIQKFRQGLPHAQDLVGLHIAPIEYLWKAIESGEFPVTDENRGRFFILPFQHALSDTQIKTWYNYRHERSVASFREQHLLATVPQGIDRLETLYGGDGSLTQVLAAASLLGLMGKVEAQLIEDRLYPLMSIPVERALDEIRRCYQGQNCAGKLEGTHGFLRDQGIALMQIEKALPVAALRRGVILGISRRWVEQNAELVKGDKHGSVANEEDRFADVGVRVIGGLPIRALEGIVALGPVEEQMLIDLQRSLQSLP